MQQHASSFLLYIKRWNPDSPNILNHLDLLLAKCYDQYQVIVYWLCFDKHMYIKKVVSRVRAPRIWVTSAKRLQYRCISRMLLLLSLVLSAVLARLMEYMQPLPEGIISCSRIRIICLVWKWNGWRARTHNATCCITTGSAQSSIEYMWWWLTVGVCVED